jgi:hypothetical protein
MQRSPEEEDSSSTLFRIPKEDDVLSFLGQSAGNF